MIGTVSGKTVLVTDANRGSSVSVIRSLGRAGMQVVAADSHPRSIGFVSRFAAQHCVYPDPEAAPQDYAASILKTVERLNVDLVIPVTESALLPLLPIRQRVEELCLLAAPSDDAWQVAADKNKTVALASKLGVPTPKTRLVQTVDEAIQCASSFKWPIVVKPQKSRVYRGAEAIESFTVSYAQDTADLGRAVQRLEGRCGILLQEYAAGAGIGIGMLLSRGRPLQVFQHRRIREYPFTGGVSSLCESMKLCPLLCDYAVRLMSSLNWTGLAMVEFKSGPLGATLMEINGRAWGSLSLAVQSGVDFPTRLAELYLTGDVSDSESTGTQYRTGVRMRNFEMEVKWLLSVLLRPRRYPFLPTPTRRQALTAGLSLLNPCRRSNVQSVVDPAPGLAEIRNTLAKLMAKRNRLGMPA